MSRSSHGRALPTWRRGQVEQMVQAMVDQEWRAEGLGAGAAGVEAVLAAYARRDALAAVGEQGWLKREVFLNGGGDTEVVHRDGAGRTHRLGAPARFLLSARGEALEAAWFRHGKPRREDGPVRLSVAYGAAVTFDLDGRELTHPPYAGRFLALVRAGYEQEEATRWTLWLHLASAAGVAAIFQRSHLMRQAGVSGEVALAAARVGAFEVDALAAISRRRAPASWALPS